MDSWIIICEAYRRKANHSTMFGYIWARATLTEKFYGITLTLAFILGLFFHFCLNGYAIFGVIVAELLFCINLNTIQSRTITLDLGGSENLPPSEQKSQLTRYLTFRKELDEKKINSGQVNDCFPLVQSQITLVNAKKHDINRMFTFLVGLLSGLILAINQNLDKQNQLNFLASIVAVSIFLWISGFFLTSKDFRYKELEYFLKLFCIDKKERTR